METVINSTNQSINLIDAIFEFCKDYHQAEVQSMIWDIITTAFTKENCLYDDAEQRSRALQLYENLTLLVGRIFALNATGRKATENSILEGLGQA